MNTTEYTKLRNVVRQRLHGMGTMNPAFFDVIRAADLAEQFHTGLRKDGITPEVYHQYSMAGFALTMYPMLGEYAVEVLVTIFLHDTIEDYPETIEVVKKDFPAYYWFVEGMSKEKLSGKLSNEEYYDTLCSHIVLAVCKGIDRTHNLSTVSVLGEKKKAEYIIETKDFVLPVLKRAKGKYPEYNMLMEHLKSVLNIICDCL